MERIDAMGGMIPAIERGFPQSEIAGASYAYQKAVEAREKIVVGVNRFESKEEAPIETLRIDREAEDGQRAKLEALRGRRDARAVRASLDNLHEAARGTVNTMPFVLEAVRAYATLGEICDVLRDVFGVYVE
jgi:methylmalonyl-CoA mutase N-terminal domain/subunit